MFKNDGFRKARLATLFSFLSNGFMVGSFVSRIPDFKHILGISNSLLGASLFFASSGVLAAIKPASKYAAKFGSGPVTKYSSFTLVLGFPLVATLIDLHFFWVTLFIYGVIQSVHDLSMNAHAAALEHIAEKRVMSTFHAAWSIGGLAGGASGGLAVALGISPLSQAIFIALVILGISVSIRNWFLAGSVDKHKINSEEARGKRPRKFWVLGILGLCGAIGEGAASDWGGVLARDTFHASPFVSALPYVIFSITMVTGRLSGDWLANKFGQVNLLFWSGILAGVGLSIGLLVGNIYSILIAWFLLGIGLATVIPMMVSASGELANREYQGVVSAAEGVAMVTGVAYFGFVIGPPLIGAIADQITVRWAMLLPAVLAIIFSLGTKKVLTS